MQAPAVEQLAGRNIEAHGATMTPLAAGPPDQHGATIDSGNRAVAVWAVTRDSLRDVTKPVEFLVKRQVQTTRGFR